MSHKVELLAPAGSFDSLKAAVNAGADAVYAGSRNFNARTGADNFDEKALSEAIEYCHSGGVKFFLVLNTLIHDHEMTDALTTLEHAYRSGIDAVIVQDIGLMRAIARHFPRLEIHASTQTTVFDLNGVFELYKAGVSRVILARECSIEHIKAITQKSPVDIEMFVHGAMCVCYSGQCLMSSFIGGRSGNRGSCAQPCRLDYTLDYGEDDCKKQSDKGPLLSLKDLSMIDRLPSIVASGVKSLKIEGRMRSPEYVACTVSIYRKYIDLAYKRPGDYRVDQQDLNDLLLIFNRGKMWSGYAFDKNFSNMSACKGGGKEGVYVGKGTKAYEQPGKIRFEKDRTLIKIIPEISLKNGDGVYLFDQRDGRSGFYVSHIQDLKGKKIEYAKPGEPVLIGYAKEVRNRIFDVYKTYDKELNDRMKRVVSKNPYRTVKIPLTGAIEIKKGQKPVFTLQDRQGNTVCTEGDFTVEKAAKTPVTAKDVSDKLYKTGSTLYEFESVQFDMDEDVFIPLTEINRLRRDALSRVDLLRNKERIEFHLPLVQDPPFDRCSFPVLPSWNGYFYRYDPDMDYAALGLDEITLPLLNLDDSTMESLGERMRKAGIKFNAFIPNVTGEVASMELERLLEQSYGIHLDGIYAGNAGTVWLLDRYGYQNIMGDMGLNIFNRHTADYMLKRGLKRVTASPELNGTEFEHLSEPIRDKIEFIVYGKIPVMTLAYCPAGGTGLCGKCDKKTCGFQRMPVSLTDRTGKSYPLLYNGFDCGVSILNADKLKIGHDIEISCNRLCFYDEDRKQIKNIVEMMKDKADRDLDIKTNPGHWNRGV